MSKRDEPRYDPESLRQRPTLAVGQADNLKLDDGTRRVWLCRCGVADGMCCENHVTVERLIGGRWQTVREECNP